MDTSDDSRAVRWSMRIIAFAVAFGLVKLTLSLEDQLWFQVPLAILAILVAVAGAVSGMSEEDRKKHLETDEVHDQQ